MSMFRLLLSLIGGVLLIGGSPLSLASEIVDGATVDEAIKRGAIIWDVRDPKAYAEGHIPGAVNIGQAGKTLRDPNEEDYIATETIEKIFEVYEESWLGYGNTLDAPAESVKFVNVGAWQGRIAKLESAVEALAAPLKAATKAEQ